MEKKELIGRKVKGFAFSSKDHQIDYLKDMVKFNNRVGTIIEYDSCDDTYCVVSLKTTQYYYPASLIEQHLVPENKTDMELLDKFALAALPSVIGRMSISASPEDVSKTCYDIAKAMLDERGKLEK